MRGPQKNRAAGSQEEEEESGNSCGHPINFKLAEPFLQQTVRLRRRLPFAENQSKLELSPKDDSVQRADIINGLTGSN